MVAARIMPRVMKFLGMFGLSQIAIRDHENSHIKNYKIAASKKFQCLHKQESFRKAVVKSIIRTGDTPHFGVVFKGTKVGHAPPGFQRVRTNKFERTVTAGVARKCLG